MKFRVLCGMTLVGLLGSASVAFAGNGSSTSGYGGTAGQVQSGVGGSSTLPFTGLNLTLIVLAACALIAVGFAMRRASRNRA